MDVNKIIFAFEVIRDGISICDPDGIVDSISDEIVTLLYIFIWVMVRGLNSHNVGNTDFKNFIIITNIKPTVLRNCNPGYSVRWDIEINLPHMIFISSLKTEVKRPHP